MDDGPGRAEVSAAVSDLGWRVVLRTAGTTVPARSLADAAEVAAVAVHGAVGDGRLSLDLRADAAVLTVTAPGGRRLSTTDVRLVEQVTSALVAAGRSPDPGGTGPRSVQALEIAVDALDIARVRPFWRAVLGYVPEPGDDGPAGALIDPRGQGPAVWFQQMDAPRPQRNRIHLDVSVPHDEAPHRIAAALAAGGVLRSAAEAPAFWVLVDPEGNEACVTTWQGREPTGTG